VFDEIAFQSRIHELIADGREDIAEAELLQALADVTAQEDPRRLAFVHRQLACLYSLPDTGDTVKAEQHFLENERLAPGPSASLETATFYFYVPADHRKTIAKVNEIKARFDVVRNASYYSALALKGQSLLALHRVDEADQVLTEMLDMLSAVGPGKGRPCGDELNFLDAAIAQPALADRCRQLLERVIPRIASQEYVERAKSLLTRLSYSA
jgi:hypothetical protein